MGFSFFSKASAGVSAALFSQAIRALTVVRLSNYSVSSMRRIEPSARREIKPLTIHLGEKILIANREDGQSQRDLIALKGQFRRLMNDFMEHRHEFEVTSYAAQLQQYYTILCDADLPEQVSLQQFETFLRNKRETFGETNANVFVCEYKLIKLYNDLATLQQSMTGRIAPVSDADERLAYLLTALNELKTQVDALCENAPDNVFMHYLNFAVQYALAKILEVQYTSLGAELDEGQAQMLADSQQVFINFAKESLDKIDELTRDAEELEQAYPKGLEFSLGKNVLSKLPAANVDDVRSHILSLQ